MAEADWYDTLPHQRRRETRARVAKMVRAKRRHQRAWARDIARLMLVASVLVLAVLAVEIGRKAVVVLNHADAGAILSSIVSQV